MHEESIRRFEQKSPLRLVSKLSRLNMNSLAGPIAGIGIARGTLPFIMEVLCAEGIFQEEISRRLGIDRAATARALSQLEAAGLVERFEDREDKRLKRVFPTAKARELSADLMGILGRQRQALFSGFSEQEQAAFLGMLHRMIDNLLACKQS